MNALAYWIFSSSSSSFASRVCDKGKNHGEIRNEESGNRGSPSQSRRPPKKKFSQETLWSKSFKSINIFLLSRARAGSDIGTNFI
jgi:hypothetical protein